MTQEERRRYLIQELLRERPSCRRQEIPADTDRQKILLRGLMNVRHPAATGKEFLEVQDDYLQEELAGKQITRLSELSPVRDAIYVCINKRQAYAPQKIAEHSVCLDSDIGVVLLELPEKSPDLTQCQTR